VDSARPLARATSLHDGPRTRGRTFGGPARAAGLSHLPAGFALNPLPLPRWVDAAASIGDTSAPQAAWPGGDTRFAAGAAIFAVDQIVRANPPWIGCWQMRLTLKASAAVAKRLRLGADEAALRDALHLTRVGDDPGPAGRLHLLLRRWATRPQRLAAEAEADILQAIGDSPAAGEFAALLAADHSLAERLSWASALPLHLAAVDDVVLRGGADGRRLRADAAGLDAVGPTLLLRSALGAHAEAVTLARRAEAVTAAAATLRTRDEGRGLALLFADDSVAPWRMGVKASGKDGMGSDRAARRFCESLHARGALRLLTDRPSLRLYGL
jgi:hypothetical protein